MLSVADDGYFGASRQLIVSRDSLEFQSSSSDCHVEMNAGTTRTSFTYSTTTAFEVDQDHSTPT